MHGSNMATDIVGFTERTTKNRIEEVIKNIIESLQTNTPIEDSKTWELVKGSQLWNRKIPLEEYLLRNFRTFPDEQYFSGAPQLNPEDFTTIIIRNPD